MLKRRVAAISLISFGIAGALAPNLMLAQNTDPSARPSMAAAVRERTQARLEEAKLKVCQKREAAIQQRSTRLVTQATKMQEKFASIAQRVQAYYVDKSAPAGKTVADYDALITTIADKQSAVQAAATQAQTTAQSFACEGEDPKGQLKQFRADMQSVKRALKEYRTAVKDLIVAVRSVTGTDNRSTSPSPEVTP